MSNLSKIDRRLRQRAIERHQDQQAAEGAQPQPAAGTEPVPGPEQAPVRKRVQRLLETSAAELEQTELEILDEMLAAAREAIALHHAEIKVRLDAHRRGQWVNTRWVISPSVFEKLAAKVARIIEIRVARRLALKQQVKLVG
ncbi:MAG: hypothetical protein H6841_08755 [Planctomycetes bacterium]|nr:hypothetical protein [Planctomycetota bacterium]